MKRKEKKRKGLTQREQRCRRGNGELGQADEGIDERREEKRKEKDEELRRGHREHRVHREEKSGRGIHRTKDVRCKTVPPPRRSARGTQTALRGPRRHNAVRKNEIGPLRSE